MDDDTLPDSLTLDEAFRAAFYLVKSYIDLEREPDPGLVLLLHYMWTDPARWGDWKVAVARALEDDGAANPDHEGLWRDRPEIPE